MKKIGIVLRVWGIWKLTLLVNKGKITVSFMEFVYKDKWMCTFTAFFLLSYVSISGGKTLFYVNEPNGSNVCIYHKGTRLNYYMYL